MLFLLTASSMFAQTRSISAVNWFNTGIREKDPDKKIEAYKKALEYDEDFVEVIYNLGLVYQQKKEYEPAEIHLQRARDLVRNRGDEKLRSGISYNLALNQKANGKIDQAIVYMAEARDITSNKEMAAKMAFDIGRMYYEQGKIEMALDEFTRGSRKYKDNAAIFENFIKLIEGDIAAEKIVRSLDNAIAAGDVKSAQELLAELEATIPSYKALRAKKALVDSLLNKASHDALAADLYQMAEKHLQEGNLDLAISSYELLLQKAPQYSDVSQKLDATRRQLEDQRLKNTLETEYASGIQALNANKWTRAIIAFEKVIELRPNYLDARSRLIEANRGLESESRGAILAQYYLDAVAAMNREEYGTALALFEKVQKFDPRYKDTRRLIERIEAAYKPKEEAPRVSDDYFKTMYEQALTHMSGEQWMDAVLVLEKLNMLAPNDPNVTTLLTQAKENLQIASSPDITPEPVDNPNTILVVGATIFALIGLPVIGVTVFSPNARARIHFLRGNYLKAAQIYERILAKHPEKLKIYTTLANIYLLLGRNDERAFRVFTMLINLNLAPHLHGQINSVMTQKYLNDGSVRHTNPDDAIEELERALKSEMDRQNQMRM
jgi:tetratricopeptide (TPR) repeat protein